jgi:hypothetical protein
LDLPSNRRSISRSVIGTIATAIWLSAAAPPVAQQPNPVVPNPPVVYAPKAAKPGGPLVPRSAGYKVDTMELGLMPRQTVEYKYRLEKGATMIYSWKADGPIRFDFHTVPDGKPISASERFEAAERREVHGVYTAPYSGLHGWWWENVGNEFVMITVHTAGFYTGAVMFSGTEQTPVDVQDPPPPK